MNMTIPYWPACNSARSCWSVVLCLRLTDMALQEAVGSSLESWAGPCLQNPGCAALKIKPLCVWRCSYSSTEQRVQREPAGLILDGRKLQVCAEAALPFCYAQRVCWTQPVQIPLGAAMGGEGPLGQCTAPENRPLWGLCAGFESGSCGVAHNFSGCT